MPYLYNHETQQMLLKNLALEQPACARKDAVLRAYEAVSRRITHAFPDLFGDDTLFAATEWVLHSQAHGELSWKDMATFLEHRADYGRLFAYLGGEPRDYVGDFDDPKTKRWWRRPHSRSRYVQQLARRPMRGDFVKKFKWLAEYLRTRKLKKTNVSKTDILAGRSAEYLRHICGVTGSRRFDDYGEPGTGEGSGKSRAETYENELLADPEFREELSAVAKAVNAKHAHRSWWLFRVDDNGKGRFDAAWGRRVGGRPGESVTPGGETMRNGKPVFDPGVDLWTFCKKWCIQEVGYTRWGDRQLQGLKIVAQRLRISRRDTGVSVFIPRYYRFNDIRRSEEFETLRHALNESYGYSTLRESRMAKKYAARRLRRSLITKGVSRAKAWEETMKLMGWSEGTMRHYMGDQPNDRIDHGTHLPKGTRLPK